MQYQKNDTVTFALNGQIVSGKVSKIENDGRVVVDVEGTEYSVAAHLLGSQIGTSGGILVDGLQPDPPMAMARLASGSGHAVLPSPVAPETKKTFYD